VLEPFGPVVILAVTIVGLIRFQQVPERVFGVAILACYLCGFVSTENVLSNAVNNGLMTLILLIICASVLEQTSYLRRLSQLLLSKVSSLTYIKTLITTLFSSAFLNNTAVVATLINPIKSNKIIPPNKLLLPLSYAAILGGTMTLVGTSTNLIVDSMLIEKGHPGFAFFDFLYIGLAVSFCCLIVILIQIPRLKGDLEISDNNKGYLVEALVQDSSALIGNTTEESGLLNLDKLELIEIVRFGTVISPVGPEDVIKSNDRLIFSGDVKKVSVLQQFDGLSMFADSEGEINQKLAEVMVRPSSSLIGKTLKSSGFSTRFNAGVVAIRRQGGRLSGPLSTIRIKPGDFLVLAVEGEIEGRHSFMKNFFLLKGKRVDNALSGWREKTALWGFIGSITVSVLFSVSLLKCFIFYLALLTAIGSLGIHQIKQRFPLELWLVVVGALTIASSLDNVGASSMFAGWIQETLSDYSVWWAFVGIFILTVIMTELITNNAAAALMLPLSYSVALGLNVNIMPFVMAVAFGASGSFISPYGYQTNLMIFNAGSYELKDFIRFGWPVSLTYAVTALTVIPLVFPF